MREFVSWTVWNEAAEDLAKELPADTCQTVSRAAAAAERWHGDQLRPTGVPYVEHLLEALEVLVRGAGVRDPDVLAAVLLHDVVEDTQVTLSEVEARMGPVVAEYVDWVTKPPTADASQKQAAKAAYLGRLQRAPMEAIWVKLADRVSNVQRLYQMPADFQRRYYAETLTHVMPLAEGHPFFGPWYATWAQHFAHLR